MKSPEGAKPKPFTPSERKAFVMGYLQAVADDEAALWARRVRIAAKSLKVDVPREWPAGGRT